MRDANPSAIYLRDYQPPAFFITQTQLHFELHEEFALVTSVLEMSRNSDMASAAMEHSALELDGQNLDLLSVSIDGELLDTGRYSVDDNKLVIPSVPFEFTLSCQTRIRPQDNTSLEGLYKSRTMFCTQCEPEGFRKITYYLDRPDVMSVFTVTIDADKARYPVLLSNGNLLEHIEIEAGRHRTVWHDPFPKPCYLFALVAGDLGVVEDSFTTSSGREVALRIYVEEKDLGKCAHAMLSLKNAMRWDEEVYGREYDLDLFNIVAVDDFNMGAMENKSLNIFNTSCVLCSPEITTDMGFARIEAIVAHEYFHNWSGNRVTCRDWFQLSLKEGFTVFRDAGFSADMGSATVKRVEDATLLRTAQFAEDAGPMSHPIRPDSYMEINNFYTLTIYEKGAEVVRMIHTLLGAQHFRQGSDLYFDRHDGQAATCEDFVCAMEDASGVDLTAFRLWYSQAGTPVLHITDDYDEVTGRYTLNIEQSCPATPGQSDKEPLVIPFAMGLLGDAGNLPLHLHGVTDDAETSDNTHRVLTVNAPQQSFVFEELPERPVPSLLRSFSAPVRVEYDYSVADLCALMSRDDDGFVRWDSAQMLAARVIREVEKSLANLQEPVVEPLYIAACEQLLGDESLDPAMVAEMLSLPSESYLAEQASQSGGADVDGIHGAREHVKKTLAKALEPILLARYQSLAQTAEYEPSAEQVAARSLRNICLDFLTHAFPQHIDLAVEQFQIAENMTDRLAALRALAFYGSDVLRDSSLATFHQDWHHETLVVNQWLQVQAMIPGIKGLERVEALLEHADFDIRNPNKVRALIGAFGAANPTNFHRIDGAGYRFLTDRVLELDALNPQVAARLLNPLTRWRQFVGRSQLMREQLQRLADTESLSPDVNEIVSKSLL